MKLFASAAQPSRQRVDINPTAFHKLQDILKNNQGNLSLKELKSANPDLFAPSYAGESIAELEQILKKHGNANNWLKSVEGKNIELHFFSDGFDPPKSYFYHVDKGEIKHHSFGGCVSETPWKRKYANADGTYTKVPLGVEKWGTPIDDVPEVKEQKHAANEASNISVINEELPKLKL